MTWAPGFSRTFLSEKVRFWSRFAAILVTMLVALFLLSCLSMGLI